jgi:hypothetical protein
LACKYTPTSTTTPCEALAVAGASFFFPPSHLPIGDCISEEKGRLGSGDAELTNFSKTSLCSNSSRNLREKIGHDVHQADSIRCGAGNVGTEENALREGRGMPMPGPSKVRAGAQKWLLHARLERIRRIILGNRSLIQNRPHAARGLHWIVPNNKVSDRTLKKKGAYSVLALTYLHV